ncbi:MAG TPA: dicarboxylate--CoA ligase PimA [Steroidobacteraceae bacterium]|nr:dicarboxylate--CoA ligase PimA [Steroidobacteraceae bacterium]
MSARPFAWERSYPPTLNWGMPIATCTLPTLLDEAVARFADRAALEFNERRISYRELGARVAAAAAGFAALGVGPGVQVALYLPNTPFHPIAFFGALRAGGRCVHLSPLDPLRALRFKLEDSAARILVTVDVPGLLANALQLLAQGAIDHLIVGEQHEFGAGTAGERLPAAARAFSHFHEAAAPAQWPPIDQEDVALLQYTGGTTGLPKGAMLTHANLSAAVSMYHAWHEATRADADTSDRVICVLPLFHIYALTTILLCGIHRGAEILLRPRFDVEALLADIEGKRATAFPGVPTMWIALNAHPGVDKRDLSSLRTVSSGGAPLPTEVAERLERLTGHRLAGGWGMTETAPAGTRLLPGQANAPGLIGVPLPGIEMQVVAVGDPHRLLQTRETGEIRVRGPNVTRGYWRRPQQSAAAYADGFFLTGDIGYMDENGCFYLVERKDDMIISGGFNVYPTVIERAIYEHTAVEEVIVIGIADAYRGQSAKAFIKLRAGAAAFTLDELRAFLEDKLGRHELPAALEYRERLPKTPVGKLWRRGLIEELQTPYAPATAG